MADLQLKKVIKRFGDVQTIHGVDLDIKSGEFIVFVGPSGCGKSTLLRVVLRDGRIEQVGSPVELYRSPENRFVAGFIGSPKMNFFPASITSLSEDQIATVKLPDGQQLQIRVDSGSCSAGDKVSVGIRPEHIRADGSGDLKLKVECQLCEYLGEMTHVFAQFQGEQIVLKEEGKPGFENGSIILAGINSENIYLFNEKDQSLVYRQQRQALTSNNDKKLTVETPVSLEQHHETEAAL